MGEYSPTISEFVYSFVPWMPHSVPKDRESMLYFNIKLNMAVGSMYLRTVYIMITTGKSFVDAGYIATNNLMSLRWMSTMRAAPGLLARGARRSPQLIVPLGYAYVTHATVTDPHFQKAGKPKPAWMPLPLWVLWAGDSRPISTSNVGPSGLYVTPEGHYRVDYSSNPHWI